ncbi:uncharacterized protein LOC107036981 [Diachasma alloeum]|uniref:uncharacterized protein LOC107036981 n=1 Tax=Diachasma alloeum TaxID=454923 RepID=UPI0007382FFC|nr:uncharacterized protein LOC107036981 [Diachasma alloeum]XP_015110766.1 uncharacterized protein LOC107036981 [Diachasma alloeum]XP_015110767.1 uncharacterized protein LOC107036981 [Diachasma alloeum]
MEKIGEKGRSSGVVDDVVTFLEKDSRGLQIFTYGVTGIGLMTALYRIRPLAKFSNPMRVPAHFIKKQTVLRGTAARIEPGTTSLILVDHKPLVPLPRLGKPRYLPVKIAGVDVNSHGVSWLSTVVQGNAVEFIPVRKTKDFLDCTVKIPQKDQELLDVGKELVKLGFGTVGELSSIPEDKVLKSYKKALVSAQNWAKSKRNGQWHFLIPPTLSWRLRNLLEAKLHPRT